MTRITIDVEEGNVSYTSIEELKEYCVASFEDLKGIIVDLKSAIEAERGEISAEISDLEETILRLQASVPDVPEEILEDLRGTIASINSLVEPEVELPEEVDEEEDEVPSTEEPGLPGVDPVAQPPAVEETTPSEPAAPAPESEEPPVESV